MRKVNRKRLAFEPQTIRKLTGVELRAAHGGLPDQSVDTDEMGNCCNGGTQTIGCPRWTDLAVCPYPPPPP